VRHLSLRQIAPRLVRIVLLNSSVRADALLRYTCGHSHCFVCIRIWLETRWTCPECVQVMDRAPFRHYAEEAGIAREYPEWHDMSIVGYSFDDLIFPTESEVESEASAMESTTESEEETGAESEETS
jgi:hypothetical protein